MKRRIKKKQSIFLTFWIRKVVNSKNSKQKSANLNWIRSRNLSGKRTNLPLFYPIKLTMRAKQRWKVCQLFWTITETSNRLWKCFIFRMKIFLNSMMRPMIKWKRSRKESRTKSSPAYVFLNRIQAFLEFVITHYRVSNGKEWSSELWRKEQ